MGDKSEIKSHIDKFYPVDSCFATGIQSCHDVPVPDQYAVNPAYRTVSGCAFSFVVVCVAAGIGTEFFVRASVQHITAFEATLFHNAFN
jgi:hypothetical protein